MMTTTLGALVQAEPALIAVGTLKLSAKSAYHVKKLARLVAAETAHFHESRNGAIKDLGIVQSDGSVSITQDSASFPAFVARINELAAVPVEIPWLPITLEMFGDEKVSAADLQALGPLFAEPEPQP